MNLKLQIYINERDLIYLQLVHCKNFLSICNTEEEDSSEMLVPICPCVTFTKILNLVLINVRTSNFKKMNLQINAHHTNQSFTLKDGEYFVFY